MTPGGPPGDKSIIAYSKIWENTTVQHPKGLSVYLTSASIVVTPPVSRPSAATQPPSDVVTALSPAEILTLARREAMISVATTDYDSVEAADVAIVRRRWRPQSQTQSTPLKNRAGIDAVLVYDVSGITIYKLNIRECKNISSFTIRCPPSLLKCLMKK